MDSLQIKIDVDTKIEDHISDWKPYYKLVISDAWSRIPEIMIDPDSGNHTVKDICKEHFPLKQCDCRLTEFVEAVTVQGLEKYISENKERLTKTIVSSLKEAQLKLRNKKRIEDKILALQSSPLHVKSATNTIKNPLAVVDEIKEN